MTKSAYAKKPNRDDFLYSWVSLSYDVIDFSGVNSLSSMGQLQIETSHQSELNFHSICNMLALVVKTCNFTSSFYYSRA